MDFVESEASLFVDMNFDRADTIDDFIRSLELELYKYKRESDRIKFLTTVSALTKEIDDEHSKVCKRPNSCAETRKNKQAMFFLGQMMDDLGVGINGSELFTSSEKRQSDQKIDDLLREVEKLKMGQEIIYNDLVSQIEELKNLYFLGKRKWHQIVAGKTIEMVASGVVSESISKKLMEIAGVTFSNLLK